MKYFVPDGSSLRGYRVLRSLLHTEYSELGRPSGTLLIYDRYGPRGKPYGNIRTRNKFRGYNLLSLTGYVVCGKKHQ